MHAASCPRGTFAGPDVAPTAIASCLLPVAYYWLLSHAGPPDWLVGRLEYMQVGGHDAHRGSAWSDPVYWAGYYWQANAVKKEEALALFLIPSVSRDASKYAERNKPCSSLYGIQVMCTPLGIGLKPASY